MQAIHFSNRNNTLAGNLFTPENFHSDTLYPAIIVIHPAGGVKEQTAGDYARHLSAAGFVTLAFDASCQGESGGEPRFLDDPVSRVDDILSAVDYMTTLSFVDDKRIGVFGVCAGGGYTVKAATLDPRIKAIATASAVNVGEATRKGWDGKSSPTEVRKMLEAVAAERSRVAKGESPAYAPYVPDLGVTGISRDLLEAADYYLTARGQHPNSQNKMLMTSLSSWAAFDAFNLVDPLLTQPAMIIAGNKADSLWHSQTLHERASGEKELIIIEGTGHMDLYDGKGADAVRSEIIPFFRKKL